DPLRHQQCGSHRRSEAADWNAHLWTGRSRAPGQAVPQDHQPRPGGVVMQRVKKDDDVVIVAGKDKGTKGKVLAVLPKNDKVLVAGVNMITRHVKPSQRNPQGGRIRKEAPIHISNVMLADPKTGEPTRVRIRTLESGTRVRIAVKSGEQIDT